LLFHVDFFYCLNNWEEAFIGGPEVSLRQGRSEIVQPASLSQAGIERETGTPKNPEGIFSRRVWLAGSRPDGHSLFLVIMETVAGCEAAAKGKKKKRVAGKFL
jgi:hypothetical protein